MTTQIRNAAKAVIIRDEHLLLTVNRDDNGHDFYILPGGGQDFGETLHDTLKRECREEIGIEVRVGELVYVRDYIGKNHEFAEVDGHVHQVEFMFLCTLVDGEEPRFGVLPDSRQLGIKWLHLAELERAPLYPSVLKVAIHEAALHRPLYLGDVN